MKKGIETEESNNNIMNDGGNDDDDEDGIEVLNDVFENEFDPLLSVSSAAPQPPTSTSTPSQPPSKTSISSLWNSLVFGWFTPVLERMQEQLDSGISPDIENDDSQKIPPLPEEDSTKLLTERFQTLWERDFQQAVAAATAAVAAANSSSSSSTSTSLFSATITVPSSSSTGTAGAATTKTTTTTTPPSLFKCLWRDFSPLFIQAGLLKFVHDCLQFVGPQVLNGLIVFLRSPNESIQQGILLTVAVTIAQLSMSLCLRHYFFQCYIVSLRIRTCVLYAIFQKSLKIDPSYYHEHPIGQVTNLMSVDVQRLQDVITYMHAVWYSFLQIGLAIYFLWKQLGPSCLAGVAVILASIPLTGTTARWMGKLQKQVMKAKDDRIQVNQETLTNMKVVKLQAWEQPFKQKVTNLRNIELKRLFIYFLARACTWLLWSSVPLLIAVATFGAYVGIAGQVLDVASALTALALFQILRFPLFMLPNVINMLVEAKVALDRIENFLCAPELIATNRLPDSGDGSRYSSNNDGDDNKVISIDNATFTYQNIQPSIMMMNSLVSSSKKHNNNKSGKEQEKQRQSLLLAHSEKELLLLKARLADAEFHLAELEGRKKPMALRSYGSTMSFSSEASSSEKATANNNTLSAEKFSLGKVLCLRRINFECRPGELVAVVGSVGSGKSTLLRSILGEVQIVSGEVSLRGKIAYFDQKAFVMNDTVQGNILFGKPKPNNSDDDSDPNVALYRKAIESCSLTHDLSLLPDGDQCEIGERGITLSGGQKARIAMARVVYHNADISLLDDCLSAVDAHVGKDLFENCITKVLLGEEESDVSQNQQQKKRKRKKTVVLVTNALQFLSHPRVDRIVVMRDGLIVESGSYQELVKGKGGSGGSSYFKSFLQAFTDSMSGDYNDVEEGAQGRATEKDQDKIQKDQQEVESGNETEQQDTTATDENNAESNAETKTGTPQKRRSSTKNELEGKGLEKKKAAGSKLMTDEMAEREIGQVSKDVYILWARAAGGLWVIVPLIFVFTANETMRVLSNWWLTYWSHAATPDTKSQLYFLAIYALINLAAILVDFSRTVVILLLGLKASSTVSSTIVVVTSVTPVFAAVLVPILFYYKRQQEYFTQSYRELKRIDSVTRSPIYALFGETLDGPATIRAFGAQHPLSVRMIGMIDRQQHAFYLIQGGLCWLAVRLELIGTVIISAACMAAVVEKWNNPEGNEVFAGLAGLSISYALSVTQTLNWMVRVGSDFEANMVAVERINQYCNLDREAPHETDADKNCGPEWPSRGVIEFKDAKLRYRPGLPLVLKGLDLRIPGHSKVGIVGRTGAGKSTLMTALMRLVELDGGKILIDGVDTSKLGLRRLRSSIAVIPQDPVLFSGTVKTNLDPFNHHNDNRLMEVLERVGLYIQDSPSCAIHSLEDKILQDGGNLSVGQRQLLVIARALLDGAGVVICDEATASIDAEADSRIQKVLRNDFANATTLTVAHRLNTIMDSSHILVMSDGKVAEFDTPANLLAKGGLFKDLVDKWEEENE